MADKYWIIDSDQSVYYYDKKGFYEFINGVNEEPEDKVDYKFFDNFPLPLAGVKLDGEDENNGHDAQGHPFGHYCPFDEVNWPTNYLLAFKNKQIFVPVKKEVTRIVEEWCEPTPTTRPRTPTKKRPTKKAIRR